MNVAERFPKYSMYSIVHLALGYKKPPLDRILFEVCAIFGQQIKDVKGNRRYRQLVICRHIFCYVAKMSTTETLTRIGQFIGGRNHATAINSIKKLKDLVEARDLIFIRAWKLYLSKSNLYNEKCDYVIPEQAPLLKLEKPIKNNKRKLTERQIDSIVRMVKRGYGKEIVSQRYKISRRRVENILSEWET